MKILLDMNLSPAWVEVLRNEGIQTLHWSSVGAVKASDHDVLAWSRSNGYVLFTHDLDFGAILAASNAAGPSVVQLRTQDVTPQRAAAILVLAIQRVLGELAQGAIVSIDESSHRIRLLPLGKERVHDDD